MNAVASHTKSFEVTPRVHKGEAVVFMHFDPKNSAWFFGRDLNGIEGYFPSSWFDIFETDQAAVALRDYDATELSITAGNVITVEEEYGNWLLVTADGGRGWIPLSCMHQADAGNATPLR